MAVVDDKKKKWSALFYIMKCEQPAHFHICSYIPIYEYSLDIRST